MEVTVTASFAYAANDLPKNHTVPDGLGSVQERAGAMIKDAVRSTPKTPAGTILDEVVVNGNNLQYIYLVPIVNDTTVKRSKNYIVRDHKLYWHETNFCEWMKAIKIFFFVGVATLIRKCILGWFNADMRKNYVPLKAWVGVIGHTVLGLASVLTFGVFSRYLNQLNGDLERWINGHTEDDLATKSLGRRCKEIHYFMPCAQPITSLKPGTVPDVIDLASSPLIPDAQKKTIAQQISNGNIGTYRPIVDDNGTRRIDYVPITYAENYCYHLNCLFSEK